LEALRTEDDVDNSELGTGGAEDTLLRDGGWGERRYGRGGGCGYGMAEVRDGGSGHCFLSLAFQIGYFFFTNRWQGCVIKLRDDDVPLDADRPVEIPPMFDVKYF
jgi:hypothetical protein